MLLHIDDWLHAMYARFAKINEVHLVEIAHRKILVHLLNVEAFENGNVSI